jgi:hypothetical protein
MKRFFRHEKVNASAIFGVFSLILGSGVASAKTVYFNDADRGPSDVLQIDGITVTHTDTGILPTVGQPMTDLGVGLGFDDGIGLVGEVDQQARWSVGESGFDSLTGGDGLSFHVDGTINSITIMPVFRIFSGSGELMPIPDGLDLEFTSSPFLTGGGFPTMPANTSTPVTLYAPEGLSGSVFSTFYLTPQSNYSPDFWFGAYRSDNLAEEQTLQWGFTVLSLDYTPATPAPEPTTTVLLVFGLPVLLGVKKYGKERRNLNRKS